MMPPKRFGRKFNPTWEKLFPWLKKALDGSEDGICKLCKVTLLPKKSILSQHQLSQGHVKRAAAVAASAPMNFGPAVPSRDVKKAELQIAVAMACHGSIIAIDHLGEILVAQGKGSTLENLKLHRTKCSKLIAKVIAPAMKSDLVEDMKGQRFSLLVDEATDLAVDKNLCLVVRYYSQSLEKINTAFLEMIPVMETTGRALYEKIMSALQKNGLDIINCIGFASDGAANMVGENNSVWSRLQEKNPNMIKFPCMCHSLALCIQNAFEKLPSHLGYLLTEIPAWFSKSPLRREAYKELFAVMDPCHQHQGNPLPFHKLSATRWLSRGKVISNILLNWQDLKAYFLVAEQSGSQDVRYKAKVIREMLFDDQNYLYFTFMSPIVSEFERVNAFFQSTCEDPEKMTKELRLHYNSLRQRVFDHQGNQLAISRVEYGAKFLSEANNVLRHHEDSPAMMEKIKHIKERCQLMLLECVSQVERRLPTNKRIFEGLSYLHPSKVLSQLTRASFQDLPMFFLLESDLDTMDIQYRNILLHSWKDEDVFAGEIPNDTMLFWKGILAYRDSVGNQPYKELANYALTCLVTPVSNAFVERVFSHAVAVKTKSRNRMGIEMLDSIIRIRTTLVNNESCCKTFSATEKMLSIFNTATLYDAEDEALTTDFLHLEN